MQETVPDRISPEDMMLQEDIITQESIDKKYTGNDIDSLVAQMNDKLKDGQTLDRKNLTFSEKRALAKVAKMKKKVDRIKKKQKKKHAYKL